MRPGSQCNMCIYCGSSRCEQHNTGLDGITLKWLKKEKADKKVFSTGKRHGLEYYPRLLGENSRPRIAGRRAVLRGPSPPACPLSARHDGGHQKGGEAQRHRPKVTDLTLHVGRLPGDLGAKRAWWGGEAQQSTQWPAPQGSWAGGSAWSQGWHSRVWEEGPVGYGSE